jgi:hypothetical protein
VLFSHCQVDRRVVGVLLLVCFIVAGICIPSGCVLLHPSRCSVLLLLHCVPPPLLQESGAKHYALKKNPLKNLGAMIKLNPQAASARRWARGRAAQAVGLVFTAAIFAVWWDAAGAVRKGGGRAAQIHDSGGNWGEVAGMTVGGHGLHAAGNCGFE